MESSIRDDLTLAMKSAMREKNKDRLEVIRFILAAFKQIEVDERIEITNDRALVILDKMQKERRDSIEQFISANRQDLVDREGGQLKIIQEFLPEPISEQEVNQIIEDAIKETSASGMQDMGKVMAMIKPKVQGRADMAKIGKKIKSVLMGE